MYCQLKKSKTIKAVSLFLAINMLQQIIAPSIALALTGGPSQPEMESFEPIGTNQMVDLFSGDFNYNLPLLTVPGPNGGYPINLSYHAGIGMEDQSSWVGLGWNINPGVIKRQMRGLPDDFSGQIIENAFSIKDDETTTFNMGATAEFFGVSSNKNPDKEVPISQGQAAEQGVTVDDNGIPTKKEPSTLWDKIKDYSTKNLKFAAGANAGLKFYNNSYRGIGIGLNSSLSGTITHIIGANLGGNTGRNFDSQNGSSNQSFAFAPGWSISGKDAVLGTDIGYSFNQRLTHSKYGLVSTQEGLNVGLSMNRIIKEKQIRGGVNGISYNAVSRASQAYLPKSSHNMSSFMQSYGAIYAPKGKNLKGVSASISHNISEIDAINDNIPSYGYFNLEDKSSSRGLLDYNTEKESATSRDIMVLPIPNPTYDLFMTSGHGTGGVFRPHRSDVGVFHKPDHRVANNTVGLAFEWTKNKTQYGGNIMYGSGTAGSSKWQPNIISVEPRTIADYDFEGTEEKDYLYESFYLKESGELNLNNYASNDIFSDDYLHVDLSSVNNPTILEDAPNRLREERATRAQNMQMYRLDEVKGEYQPDLYAVNEYPRNGNNIPYQYDTNLSSSYSSTKDGSLLAKMINTTAEGFRYEYGIPAYNFEDKSVTVSVDESIENVFDKTINYEVVNASTNPIAKYENKGRDDFYNRTVTPRYAHSFLLTAVYSPDYVDLTGDGPSDDDLGYYVKFNYTRTASENDPYKWRYPFSGAAYQRGYYSDQFDGKGFYQYGKKEVYYVNSIETKTHIAEFHLSDRMDARGVFKEHQHQETALGKALKQLDRIDLYSKNDLKYIDNDNPVSIKSVHFHYTNELCRKVPNNINSGDFGSLDYENSGKLTLSKLWFTYNGNGKGAFSPYEFDYHSDIANENPDYNIREADRWGNFKPENEDVLNDENPYVNQSNSYNNRDQYASAWSLKGITFPSGSKLYVNYEQDSYTHVQERQAMQMYEVVAYENLQGNFVFKNRDLPSGENPNYMKHNNGRILFQLNHVYGSSSSDEADALAAVDQALNSFRNNSNNPDHDLYFKSFMHLGTVQGDEKMDYVEGYVSFDPSTYGTYYDPITFQQYGYITLPAKLTDQNNLIHPFILEAIRQIRDKRQDYGEGNGYNSVSFSALASIYEEYVDQSEQLSRGFDTWAYDALNPNIEFLDKMPSYIRLYANEEGKYGGGHRIKSIVLDDNWGNMVENGEGSTYGTLYRYTTKEGKSSGVASYEPMLGGEEIPHRLPLRYHSNRYVQTADRDLYVETPIGESFYPLASVGYSRIETRSLTHEDQADKSKGAISVTEFFTAKDFPVRTQHTDIKLVSDHDVDKWVIPYIPTETIEKKAFVQSYLVNTNDMHGKPKSVGTYRGLTDLNQPNAQPVHSIKYDYHTIDPYDENRINTLQSTVKTLMPNGTVTLADLGKNYDVALESNINKNVAKDVSLDVNYFPEVGGALVVPLVYMNNISSSLSTLVSLKVINQMGILKKVTTYQDGANLSQEHKLYDGQTGQPISSVVNTEYNKPIYTYSHPGYLNYANMGGSWQNSDMKINDVTIGVSGDFELSNPSKYFTQGDELLLLDGAGTEATSDDVMYRAWVSNIDENSPSPHVILINEENAPITGGDYEWLKVVRSGYRNHLSTTNTSVTALGDISTDILRVEENILAIVNALDNGTVASLKNCDNQQTVTLTSTDIGNELNIGIVGGSSSIGIIALPEGMTISGFTDLEYLGNYRVKIDDEIGVIRNLSGTYMESCVEILNSSGVRYASDWTYNYVDADAPQTNYGALSNSGYNKYRYGQSGVFRPLETLGYKTERTQTELGTDENLTNITEDGVYESFRYFNPYDETDYDGEGWTVANTITKYDPYGFELENKDPLGRYSAALFGYQHSLATAIGSNSSYHELVFDGFEDYNDSETEYDHGHLYFQGDGMSLSDVAHTGKKSLSLSEPVNYVVNVESEDELYFKPQAGKKYVFSYWYKTDIDVVEPITLAYIYSLDSSPSDLTEIGPDNLVDRIEIEGWKRYMGVFTIPTDNYTGINFSIKINGLYDDIRIHPFNGTEISYVYDANSLKLLAELDNENFATLYNYDDEGMLIQVKKETEKGIVTLKSTRSHTQISEPITE